MIPDFAIEHPDGRRAIPRNRSDWTPDARGFPQVLDQGDRRTRRDSKGNPDGETSETSFNAQRLDEEDFASLANNAGNHC